MGDPARAPQPPAQAGRRRRAGWGLPLAFGLLAFLVLVVVAAPAGVVARIVPAFEPRVALLAPAGRLWSGSADLVFDGQPLGRIQWTLVPASLVRAQLAADLVLTAPGHGARARASIGATGRVRLDAVSAELEQAALRDLLAPYSIFPAGRILVTEGTAVIDEQQLRTASADASWSGGPVRYQLGGQSWFATFPPLDAELEAVDGVPLLVIRDPDAAEVLDVRIDGAGWAHLRIRYRLVAMAGFPWPDPPAPDTVVVEVSEQILR